MLRPFAADFFGVQGLQESDLHLQQDKMAVKEKDKGNYGKVAICFPLRLFSEWTEAASMLHQPYPYCSICIPPVPGCMGSVLRAITFAVENSRT